jgi:hypothetical protein
MAMAAMTDRVITCISFCSSDLTFTPYQSVRLSRYDAVS